MHIWERRLLHCVPVSLKSFDAVKLKLIMLLLNCILMKPKFEYLSSSIFKTKQVPGQNSWILMPSSAESLRNRYNRAIVDPHGEKRHREYTEEVYDFNILHLVFFFWQCYVFYAFWLNIFWQCSYDSSSDISLNSKKQVRCIYITLLPILYITRSVMETSVISYY